MIRHSEASSVVPVDRNLEDSHPLVGAQNQPLSAPTSVKDLDHQFLLRQTRLDQEPSSAAHFDRAAFRARVKGQRDSIGPVSRDHQLASGLEAGTEPILRRIAEPIHAGRERPQIDLGASVVIMNHATSS